MSRVLFSLGNIHVYGYGFMIAIGVVVGLLLAAYRTKRAGLDENKTWAIGFIGILLGFGGGKLLYMIVEWKRLIKDPLSVIGSEGFVVYGGIGLGLLCTLIYCKAKKISFLEYGDIIIPSLSIGQGFGRIGCFMAGCCYGAEAHDHFGVTFPTDSLAPSGVLLIPTQLYSAIGNFAIAGILILIEAKTRKTGRIRGLIVALYLIFYSTGRFVIEFFRSDSRGSVGELSTSQFIAIFMAAIGVLIIIVQYKRRKIGK